MHVPPVIKGGLTVRAASLVVGLALFSLSIVLMLESSLGLAPWDVLNQGIGERTPLSFGFANVSVAVCVLVLAWRLGARIGPGTLANATLIGLFVELFARLDVLERLSDEPTGVRVAMLACALVLVGVGSGLYIGADLGAGPRDSLMLVGSRRTGVRIGVVRSVIELAVTLAGLALGGTVGIGTIAFALAIGPSVELGFRLLVGVRVALPGPLPPTPSTSIG